MRKLIWTSLAVLAPVVLATAGCQKRPEAANTTAPAAASTTPPARKPGLWEQRVSNGEFVQVSRLCLDAAVDRKISWWGEPATRDVCQKNLFIRLADGRWRISSVCDMGSGGRQTTVGTASGDFDRHYQVTAVTSTTGAAGPQMNGTRRLTIDAAWQGPCPAGLSPGEMTLPGGARIDVLGLGK